MLPRAEDGYTMAFKQLKTDCQLLNFLFITMFVLKIVSIRKHDFFFLRKQNIVEQPCILRIT